MRVRRVVLAAVLGCSSWIVAQSTTPQTPRSGTEGQSSAGTEQSTAPGGHAGMHRNMSQRDMSGMGAQHMAAMKQQVTKMQGLLDQMKSNVNGMSGANKQAMQANVELWQMMIDHMNQMVEHMGSMGSMMQQHHGMGAGPGHSPHAMHGQGDSSAPSNSSEPAKGEKTNPPTPPES